MTKGADSAAVQAAQTEAYRRSPYPSLIHPHTHPDRLATIARLAGMQPPAVETARILDIGVGDGLNLLSIAQALPDATCVGFDIEAEGIERGRARQAAAGITNATLLAADLLDDDALPAGEYDYIVAHGLYAWVPKAIGEALLALIARRLSPNGIAFVSFNALPGCYARMPIRDAVVRAAAGADDDADRLARGLAALEAIGASRDKDSRLQAGIRQLAQAKQDHSAVVLLHDELGPVWRPQYLRDTLEAARGHGLKFLGDSSPELILGATLDSDEPPPDDPDAYLAERACVDDEMNFRLFRRLLLVRDAAPTTRALDPRVIETLYASSRAKELEENSFAAGDKRIRCEHPPLVETLRRLAAAAPTRVPVRDLGLDDTYLKALVALYDFDMLALHTTAGSWATSVGERPRTSPLARIMLAEGMGWAASLDHRNIAMQPDEAAVVIAVDGSTSRAALTASMARQNISSDRAFGEIVTQALLMR